MKHLNAFLVSASLFALAALCSAQNDVKGQEQLSGALGTFGTTYSLQTHFNIAFYSAKYTLEPFDCYGEAVPDEKSKLIVFELSIKNISEEDNFFNSENMGWQVVDDQQNVYPVSGIQIQSMKNAGFAPTLKPGQGIGQPSLNDPLRMVFKVPVKSVITKLIIGVGRLNTSEQVIRYLLVPAPKASANDKNIVAPLPDNAHDPSDPTGAVALDTGKAKLGEFVPTGPVLLSIDEVSSPDAATLKGEKPGDGKKFIVAKITFKQAVSEENQMFYVLGGNDHNFFLKDADGDPYPYTDVRKNSSDDEIPDRRFKLGDQYTFRMFFEVPATLKPTQICFSTNGGHPWAIDLPASTANRR